MKAKKFFKISALVLLFIAFFIILGANFWAFSVVKDVKLDKTALESTNKAKVIIKDVNNEDMDYFSSIKVAVPYNEISPNVIHAFVSLEDKRFFEHKGLDYKRIIGATLNNVKAGYFKEGGSTITQQLAKNALLTQEKTVERKLKEAKLALEMEKTYSKEEIITKYLNTIYFGHSLYGIKSASERLFNKEPKDLTLSEGAILAGIVKNPLKNSPLNSIENAISRRNLVLKLMLDQGYITENQYEQALNEEYTPLKLEDTKKENIPYTQAVIMESANILGISEREVITNGYEIHTFFDKDAQILLDNVFNNRDLHVDNAEKTLLFADNTNGGINAYISTINFSPYEYRRQGASTLKPFLAYAPAYEQGLIIPDSPILDEKCEIRGYSPNNYQNSYLGWTTVRESIASSSNVCSVKLMDLAGMDYALSLGKDFGLTFDKKDGLASALGGTTYGQTIPELVTAYMSIANCGIKQSLSFIKAIYDQEGKLVYQHNSSKKRVVSNETAYFLTDTLLSCSEYGTAKKLRNLDVQVASKTGTNGNPSGNYDAWNLSYTTSHTLAVWYGSKDYTEPLDLSVTGGSYPTISAKTIWNNLDKAKNFTIPNTIDYAEIDKYAYDNSHILMLANENTPIEYKKPILISEKCNIPISNYFDNSIPNDFEAIIGDGEVVITFTRNPRFYYTLENSLEDTIYKIEKGSGKVEITLPKPNSCFELYYLSAYTEDNVQVKKSQPKVVITL